MLKTIMTRVRGAAFRAEEEFADRGALLILDQQIPGSAAAIERAQRACGRDHAGRSRRKAPENHAVAHRQAIAVMEADRDAIREARATFVNRIEDARAERLLMEIARGKE